MTAVTWCVPCPIVGHGAKVPPVRIAYRRPSRALYIVGFLALLVLALAACDSKGNKAAAPPPRPEVSVVTLHPQSVAITARLPGRTTAFLTAEVRPQVSGIIQRRLFKEGSDIVAGTLLYELDASSYQATYDAAAAALQKAQAAVPTAQAKLERKQILIKQSNVSKQDLDDAVAVVADANASVAVAKANLEAARINLDHTKITAPIDGRIGKSTLTPGALVTASQTIVLTTIRKVDPIYVDVTQSSVNLLKLRRALQQGRLTAGGAAVPVKLMLEDGTLYEHEGALSVVELNVDESTGTFTLRAEFPNPDRLLLPGIYVHAIVSEGVASGKFLVPQRAVSYNTKGDATATFVDADSKVKLRTISVRRAVGNYWLVDDGIKDGDRLVVEGTLKVRDGQAVNPMEVTIDEAASTIVDLPSPSANATPPTTAKAP
jgi:membrane fusion protein, multidrug efflux system